MSGQILRARFSRTSNSARTAAISKIPTNRTGRGKYSAEMRASSGVWPLGNKAMDYYNSPRSHQREIHFIVAQAGTLVPSSQKSVIGIV